MLSEEYVVLSGGKRFVIDGIEELIYAGNTCNDKV